MHLRPWTVIRYHKHGVCEAPMANKRRYWTLNGAIRRKERLERSWLGQQYYFEVARE